MHHGKYLYEVAPIYLHRFGEIEKKIGSCYISPDEHDIKFLNRTINPDQIWVPLSTFTHCNTVDEMIIAFANVAREHREKKSNEDQERAQWNYCLCFVLGCIVAPIVIWYAKT
jgi:hypothetical protein